MRQNRRKPLSGGCFHADRPRADDTAAVRRRDCGDHAARRAPVFSLCQRRVERNAIPGHRSGCRRHRRLRPVGDHRLTHGYAKPRRQSAPGFMKSSNAYFAGGVAGVAGTAGTCAGNCDGPPIPVVDCGAVLPAAPGGKVAVLLFTPWPPAIRNIAINAITTRPAIQPQVPPPPARRLLTGSLSELPYSGSVLRGSVMSPSISKTRFAPW